LNLLLDTHVAIWAQVAPNVLPPKITKLLADQSSTIYVSAVSIWEIAIKYALGKSSRPPFSGKDAIAVFERAGCKMLAVSTQHAAAVDELPLLHGDPFDRLLIAQALSEPLRLVTHDKNIAQYSDAIISW
jgi:PIN domain nuclease of toxin-antitoxin system